VGSIDTDINVSAGSAIGAIEDLLAAVKELAAEWSSMEDKMAGGLNAGGAGKLAEQMDAAAESIGASVESAVGKIGQLGAAADKVAGQLGALSGAGKSLADIGAGAGTAADEVEVLAGATGKLEEGLAGAADAGKAVIENNDALAGSSPAVAEGFKATGAAATDSAGALGDYSKAGKTAVDTNADVAASAKATADAQKAQADAAALAGKAQADAAKAQADAAAWSAETASISADAGRASAAGQAEATLGIAKSNSVLADSYAAVGTTSIEQDAAVAQGIQAKKIATQSAAQDAETAAEKYKLLGIAGVAAAAVSIDMAGKFQQSTDRLVTSAGESAKNLGMVQSGILGMSVATNTSAENLAAGAYWTESAGFHGQRELGVEKAEAQGAQAEGADLPTVANALTTLLTDAGMTSKDPAKQAALATQGMNEIIAAVGQGKMTTQGLASALPQVLPTAELSHISVPQILGSLASMTAQGMSAEQSAQDLSHTIGHIQTITPAQSAMLGMLGINPNQLSTSLGKQGITGVVGEVDAAIKKRTDPQTGMVTLDTLNQSKLAVQAAHEAIAGLPESLRGIATGYLTGKTTKAEWYAETGNKSTLPAIEASRLASVGTEINKALGFSDLITSGMGDKITAAAAQKGAFGDATGQKTAAMLGGDNLDSTKEKVDGVATAAKHTGDNIANWGLITKQFSFQLGSAEKAAEALGISFGSTVLPEVTPVLHALGDMTGFLATNQGLVKDLSIGAAGLGAAYLATKAASAASTVATSIGKVGQALGIPGSQKLGGAGTAAASDAGSDAASEGLGKLAGAASGAAGALGELSGAAGAAVKGETAVGAAGKEAAVGETAAGKAGTGEAAGETEAGAAGRREAVGEEEGGAGGGGGGGGKGSTIAIATIAMMIAQPIIDGLQNKKNNKVLGDTNEHSWFNSYTGLGHGIEGLFNNSVIGKIRAATDGKDGAAPAIPASESRLQGIGPVAEPAPRKPVPLPMPEGPSAGYTADTLKVGAASLASIKVKVEPEIDSGSIAAEMASVKSKASQALTGSGASMTPIKVPAPDLSALDLAKAKAASAAAGIMSAIRSGTGGASSIGASMDTGLAAGIAGGAGAAIAAAHAVASEAAAAMSHALDAHSPSRVTKAIGSEEFDKGFADGIGDDAQVKAAATGLSKSAVASLTAGLQGGASAIAAAKALATGVATPFKDSTIADTITKMEDDVAKALKKHKIDKSEDSAMVAYLKADAVKLQALAKQRSSLESQIQQAQSYASNITASANQGASIVNIASTAESTEAGNAPTPVVAPQMNDLVSGMQSQIAQTKQFNSDVAKLKKEGLNKSQLDQIMQAGAATGDPIAQTILASGKSGIAELNKLAGQMNTAAHQLGVTAGNAMTEPASEIGGKLAQGLKNQLGTVDKSISSLASGMTSAINAALGSGAGAAAFTAGQKIAGDLAAGVASGTGGLASAIVTAIDAALDEAGKKTKKKEKGGNKDIELGAPVSAASAGGYAGLPLAAGSHPAAAVPHPASAVPSGGGSGGGGGGSVTHQTTTVLTVDGAEMARVVQDHTLERGLSNLGAGLVPSGRSA
jgi:hypothetical protein